jgi:hypothetical protein
MNSYSPGFRSSRLLAACACVRRRPTLSVTVGCGRVAKLPEVVGQAHREEAGWCTPNGCWSRCALPGGPLLVGAACPAPYADAGLRPRRGLAVEELLSAVDVERRAGDGGVRHQVDGEGCDVLRADDTPYGQARA